MLVVTPGNPKTFTEYLSDIDNAPAVPVKPGTVQISDSRNEVVYQGELFRASAEGFFEFQWTPLARTPNNPYTIVWKVPTAAGLVSSKTQFEIEEKQEQDFSFVNFVTEGFKNISVTVDAAGNWQLKMYDQAQNLVWNTYFTCEDPALPIKVDYFGHREIPAGEYTYICESASGDQLVNNLHVAPLRFWQLLPRFRTAIDRAKYPWQNIKAYRDDHAYSWFVEGMAYINRVAPTTDWNWATFPKAPKDYGLEGYIVKAAQLHALRSQLLLENELAFDYQGPNVNVSYDHTAGLEAEIGRLEAELEQALKDTKMDYFRKGQMGTLIHRAYGSSSYGRRQMRLGR